MGYALARAAIKAGHKVTLITAPTVLRPPKQAKIVHVVTSDEMFKAVKDNFDRGDCLIMAAAVSDYKPDKGGQRKIKKEQAVLSLDLKPTTDILKWAGQNKSKGQVLVGFALEDTNLLENAEKKMKAKKLDMIVANEPAAIGAEKSTIYIKTKTTDWQILKNTSKTTSAKKILNEIIRLQ
jgi:phosphopantothenoylcysteine decarboxylase/phosphopantothenate--cysteine ligase